MALPDGEDTADRCTQYPVGAFVTDYCNVSHVVKALRSRGLLKVAPNVTPFDPRRCRWYASPAPDRTDTRGAEELVLYAPHAGTTGIVGVPLFAVPAALAVWHEGAAVRADVADDALQLLRPEAPEGPPLLAVHTDQSAVGAELMAALVPSVAVMYLYGLRVYSEPCLTGPGAAETALPSASPGSSGAPRKENVLPAPLVRLRQLALAPPAPREGFTFSELFGGIGMFRVGLERIGGTSVLASELAVPARTTYLCNFPGALLCGDVTRIPSSYFPPHDLLTAGFPCQSFSKAGPATGLRDRRGWLFFEVVRVLSAAQPRAFLLENVENVVEVDAGEQLREILAALRAAGDGYVVSYRVLDGVHVTPQRRRRVYFVGLHRRLGATQDAVDDVLAAVDCSFAASRADSHDALPPPAARTLVDILDAHPSEALRLTPAQWEAVQRSATYRRNPSWRIADLSGVARTLMGSYRSSFPLYSEFVPFPVPPGSSSPEVVPPFRFYSMEECKRLQGVPVDYVFPVQADGSRATESPPDAPRHGGKRPSAEVRVGAGPEAAATDPPDVRGANVADEAMAEALHPLPPGAVYKLIGNAVNPDVIERIGRSLRPLLMTRPATA